MAPAGAFVMRASTIRFRGKINIGGIYVSAALVAHITVTDLPLSPFSHLFGTFAGNDFRGILYVRYPCLVHIPKSMGTIPVARYMILVCCKKYCTRGSLNSTALEMFMPSGFRIINSGWRDIKPLSQSQLAILPSLLKRWLIFIHVAKSHAIRRTFLIVRTNNAFSMY